MNPATLVAVFCYQGDQHRVEALMLFHKAHGCPIVALSPEDSPVVIPGADCLSAGRRAYIGQESLDRQRAHLRLLLTYPHQYFFLADSDSFCLSPEFPPALYEGDAVWSNEVPEPRPHVSPYPKIAMQPPYFLSRVALQKLLDAPDVPAHPITPYIDWYMLALCHSAGLTHRSFAELETPVPTSLTGPWDRLNHRIRVEGGVMMHPIKEPWQIEQCARAYRSRIPR